MSTTPAEAPATLEKKTSTRIEEVPSPQHSSITDFAERNNYSPSDGITSEISNRGEHEGIDLSLPMDNDSAPQVPRSIDVEPVNFASLNDTTRSAGVVEAFPVITTKQTAPDLSSFLADLLFDFPSEWCDGLGHAQQPQNSEQLGQTAVVGLSEAEQLDTLKLLPDGPPPVIWPLQSRQDADLFRYFIDDAAVCLDMCDPERHFGRIVPQRAMSCPPLFYAMLAAAAQRLSRVSSFDSRIAELHYQNCLRTLIPALSESTAAMDENLLAAVVILRFMEEVHVSVAGPGSSGSHLIGTRIMLAAQERPYSFSGLRLAAFWVALRQDIHMAYYESRPIHPNFVLSNLDSFMVPRENECCYANRIICHFVACLQYCFGDEERTVAGWKDLVSARDQWWQQRPSYFNPVYQDQSESLFFPELRYTSDAVVFGIQMYHFSHLLLVTHNPQIPRLGPGARVATKAVDEDVIRTVRIICGIAESNPGTRPAYA